MKRGIILPIVLLLLCTGAFAHQQPRNKPSSRVLAFADSLAELRASYYAHIRLWDDMSFNMPKRMRRNPDLYKLIAPPTYYEGVVKQATELKTTPVDYEKKLWQRDSIPYARVIEDTLTSYKLPNLEKSKIADQWVNQILLGVYLQQPLMVKGNELSYRELKALGDDHVAKTPKKENVAEYLQIEPVVGKLDADHDLLVVRPNFWKYAGNGYVNYSQNFISDNWYKGGESTNSLLSGLTLQANYDDRQKVEIENKLEIRLGFITAPSDTMHTYKTNADLFRLSSKIGVKARKNIYYTLATELRTQFFGNYKTNTNDMISNFLSPMQIDLTLGLDYKRSEKNYAISVLGSPLAYSFVYIKDADKIENTTTFNVPEGHRVANLFGSKIAANLKWTIIPNIVWETKFDYFTTYETVIANWENTFSFILNKFLSTKLFVHARFDDGVTLNETNKSYFQLQELLSFGVNYTW
ncbi:MAG: DUF3078 domain-containing protein [Phocaeicola sp.]